MWYNFNFRINIDINLVVKCTWININIIGVSLLIWCLKAALIKQKLIKTKKKKNVLDVKKNCGYISNHVPILRLLRAYTFFCRLVRQDRQTLSFINIDK